MAGLTGWTVATVAIIDVLSCSSSYRVVVQSQESRQRPPATASGQWWDREYLSIDSLLREVMLARSVH